MSNSRKMIAKNIANMLHDGDFVNLGVGIPTLVSNYIPKDITVLLHAENGCIGQDNTIIIEKKHVAKWEAEHSGDSSNWESGHKDLSNANCDYITLIKGGCCFDSSVSFAIARGGHLNATILGGLQVDSKGNLANWIIPGTRVTGMGGAMDLVSGAQKVIIAMEHCTKEGDPKIRKECTLPLTAVKCVDVIVTELCILECYGSDLHVIGIAPHISPKELQEKTNAKLLFDHNIKKMLIP